MTKAISKFKTFNQVKIGDLGEDYVGEKGIIKAKGSTFVFEYGEGFLVPLKK